MSILLFFAPSLYAKGKLPSPSSYRHYAHSPSSVCRAASRAFAPPKRNITYPPPIKTVVSSSGNPLYATPQRPTRPPAPKLTVQTVQPCMAHSIHRKRAAQQSAALSQLF